MDRRQCLGVLHNEAMVRGVGRVHSHAGGALKRRHVSCAVVGRGRVVQEGVERRVRRVFPHVRGAPKQCHVSYVFASPFFSKGMLE